MVKCTEKIVMNIMNYGYSLNVKIFKIRLCSLNNATWKVHFIILGFQAIDNY